MSLRVFFFSFIAFVLLVSCTNSHLNSGQQAQGSGNEIRNIIMMIGDGMGPGQLGLLEDYARRAPNSVYNGKQTAISKFASEGVVGLSANHPHGSLVVDSACSATQLATGVASGSEMIGLNWQGNSVETILEDARAMGKATGLVSDTRLTHATPAAFAAHQPHRSMENKIAADMLSANVDIMLSGGLRHWIPKTADTDKAVQKQLSELIAEPSIELESKRGDNRNLLLEARDRHNYQLAFNRKQMDRVNKGKLLGLFAGSGMADGISYSNSKTAADRTQPSLREMTITALQLLEQDQDGFFLMIEGGQIDWAAHNNDAGTMLHELLKFDEAVAVVYDWVKDRSDTLVVITADHETGSFGFSYGRHNLYEARKLPGEAFAGRQYRPNYNFGRLDILDKLYAQKKSFEHIWQEAAINGGGEFPTAASLQSAISANTGFEISLEQAQEILEREPNAYYEAGHSTLSAKTFPKVNDFKQFYVFGDLIHLDLIARKLAKHQSVVWGTGTHTHTPVQVIAWGPAPVIEDYSGFLHHTEIGKLTKQALSN